jgi:hypothetical protein
MPFTTVPDKATGDIFTEFMWDTFIRDNINWLKPNYATTLPASPSDGQQAILVDSTTNPTYIWQFRYNAGSSSAYKWEFVGGAPKVVQNQNTESTTTGGAWVDVTTAGPLFVVPRAGDYYVSFASDIYSSVNQGGCNVGICVALAAPSFYGSSGMSAGTYASVSNEGPLFAVGSGVELRLRYLWGVTGTNSVRMRNLTVWPIRVS